MHQQLPDTGGRGPLSSLSWASSTTWDTWLVPPHLPREELGACTCLVLRGSAGAGSAQGTNHEVAQGSFLTNSPDSGHGRRPAALYVTAAGGRAQGSAGLVPAGLRAEGGMNEEPQPAHSKPMSLAGPPAGSGSRGLSPGTKTFPRQKFSTGAVRKVRLPKERRAARLQAPGLLWHLLVTAKAQEP